MKCPACAQEFRLTIRLYFKAGMGKFPCPCCETQLEGRHLWWYWPVLVLSILAGAIPTVPVAYIATTTDLFLQFYSSYRQLTVGMGLGLLATEYLGIWIPCGRYLEDRFAILVPAPVKDASLLLTDDERSQQDDNPYRSP